MKSGYRRLARCLAVACLASGISAQAQAAEGQRCITGAIGISYIMGDKVVEDVDAVLRDIAPELEQCAETNDWSVKVKDTAFRIARASLETSYYENLLPGGMGQYARWDIVHKIKDLPLAAQLAMANGQNDKAAHDAIASISESYGSFKSYSATEQADFVRLLRAYAAKQANSTIFEMN